jgi:hypothetical protein
MFMDTFAPLVPPDQVMVNGWLRSMEVTDASLVQTNVSGTSMDRSWTDRAQVASLDSAPGRIVYRFHARDVHLVLGPASNGKPIRFRVRIDGTAPGVNHGVDTDGQGNGTIVEHRLYQVIRQKSAIEDRTFEMEFLDPGVQAFAFTFG